MNLDKHGLDIALMLLVLGHTFKILGELLGTLGVCVEAIVTQYWRIRNMCKRSPRTDAEENPRVEQARALTPAAPSRGPEDRRA